VLGLHKLHLTSNNIPNRWRN